MPYKRMHKNEKKKFIQDYKMEKGCEKCGYNEIPQALELDHIDRTKKKAKMARMHHYGWNAIMMELENCQVLCANCHRKKTTEEKDYLETDYVEPEELQYNLFGGDEFDLS